LRTAFAITSGAGNDDTGAAGVTAFFLGGM